MRMDLEALNESDISFRRFAENFPGIIYRVLIEENNRMVFFNNMVQIMTGYNTEDLKQGKVCSIFPLILPEDRIYVINAVKNAIRDNVPFEVKYRIKHKSGEIKWFFEKGWLVIGDNGKSSYIDGVILDITKRKETKQKLKESEEEYTNLSNHVEMILDHIPGLVFYKDVNKNFIRINQKVVDYFNRFVSGVTKLTKKDIEGKSLFDIVPKDLAQEYWNTDLEVISSGKPKLNIEESFETERDTRWFITNKIPHINKNGEIIGVIGFSKDITEQKKMGNILRKNEERLQTLISNAPIVIWALDSDGIFTLSDGRGLSDLGLKPGEIVGQSIFDVYREAPHIIEDNLRALAGEKFNSIVELGDLIYESVYQPLKDQNGNISGIIGIAVDITRRKKVEQRLEESEENYRKQNLFLNNIIESLTHPFYVINVNDYTIELANSTAYSMGLDKGLFCYRATHKRDTPCEDPCVCPLEEVKKTKKACMVEHTHFNREGDAKVFEIHGYPILDEDGNVIQMIEYALDITGRTTAENKFRNLIEQSIDGVVLVNENGIIVEWNKGQEQISGLKKEDALGRPLWDVQFQVLPDENKNLEQYEMIKRKIKEVLKSGKAPWLGKIQDINIQLVNSKENRILQQLPFLINTKNKIMLGNFSRDITEQKHAYKKIQEKQATLESIFRAAPTGIGMSKNRVFTQVNDLLCSLLGYTREELLNKNERMMYPSNEDYEFVRRENLEQIKKFGISTVETRFQRNNGEILDVLLSSVPVDLNNISVGETFTALDITERKKVERELKESEEKYRTLIETSPSSIILLDSRLTVIKCNKNAERFLNLTGEEVIGKNLFDVFKLPKEIKNWLFKQVPERPINKTRVPVEFEYFDGQGKKIWVSSHFSLFKIGDKDYIQLVSEEITERKKAEIIIREEIEKLKEIDQLKNEFVVRASHELKTPLVSICGSVEFLLNYCKEDLSRKTIRHIEAINRGGNRLRLLVEELLDILRIESNKFNLNLQNKNLGNIIKYCIFDLIYLAEEREITIDTYFQHDLYIDVDEIKIGQVFINLISNALKNTPRYGHISISLEKTEDYVNVKIKDTGVGFTEEEKTKIFKKFGKVERYGKGLNIVTEGSGLGLYLSKEIVELHGGKIWMESEGRNKGSNFIIKLPFKKE